MKHEGTTTAQGGIILRCNPKLKSRLLELAIEDQRSLAGYAEIVLQAHVDKIDEKRRERR